MSFETQSRKEREGGSTLEGRRQQARWRSSRLGVSNRGRFGGQCRVALVLDLAGQGVADAFKRGLVIGCPGVANGDLVVVCQVPGQRGPET